MDIVKTPKPIAWITDESVRRLKEGGNCKGTVPMHCKPSHLSKIGLYTEEQMQVELKQKILVGCWTPISKQDNSAAIAYCIVRNAKKDLLGFGSFVSFVGGDMKWVTEHDFKDEVYDYLLLPAGSYNGA